MKCGTSDETGHKKIYIIFFCGSFPQNAGCEKIFHKVKNQGKYMNTISAKIVEKTWQETAAMSPSEAPKVINKLTKQQPLILSYLMAAGHDVFNQDEQELLLFMGINIWKMMSQGKTSLPKVSEKTLDKIKKNNFKMLDYLEGEPGHGFTATVEKIFSNYNQSEVLRYVVEALFEEEEEDVEIRDEMMGMLMLYLKTVIDCFDR